MKKKTNTRAENSPRLPLEGMPEASAVLGAGGEIVHANKALTKLLGKPLARITGARFGDFVDAAHRKSFDAMLKSRLASGTRMEIVLHTPGGESVPVLLSGRLMPAEDGARKHFIILMDLREMKEVHVERREAERAALAERLRLFEVLETLPVYVVLLSPDYHVPFANKFFRDRFGDSRGKRCFEYLFERTEPCENCESYTTMRTGKRHHWVWAGPDGRTYDIHDFPFRDWDGSPLIMEMGIDITEQIRAEESQRQVSQYSRSLIEASPDPLVTISSDGKITDVNEATIKATGVPRRKLIGTDFSGYFTEPKKARAGYRQVFAQGHVTDYPLTLRGKDGTSTDVLYNATVYKDGGGNVLGVFAAARDVTARKRAEEELRRHRDHLEELVKERTESLEETTARLQTTIDSLAEGLLIADLEGNFIQWNPAVAAMLGFDRPDDLARSVSEFRMTFELSTEEDGILPKEQWPLARILRGETLNDFEIHISRRTRDWKRVFNYGGKLARDRDGKPLLAVLTLTDITERKRSEEAILRAKEEWERTFDSVPDLIAILDEKHHVLRANRAMAERLGLTSEQCVGLPCYRAVHGTDSPPAFCPHVQTMLDGREHTTEICENRLGGDFIVSTTPVYGKEGRLIGSVHVARDITERKRAEKEIESLARFPSENPSPIMRLSREGVLSYANEASGPLLRMWSCAMGTAVPEDMRRSIAEAFAARKPKIIEIECDGRIYSFVVVPVAEADYVNLYGRDITEGKRAEEALREKEKDLNRAQAVARVGSWRLNVRSNELVWSAENHRIFGIPPGTPMTYETFLSSVHPDDRDFVDERWTAALRGEQYDVEHRIVVGGEIRWVRERAELEFSYGGELVGGFGTTQDITERKAAEEEIERSRLWLERIAGTTPDVIFVLDIVESRSVYANRSLVDVLGYSPEEAREMDDVLEKAIEPEDLARAAEFYRNMADAKPGEIRVLTHRARHRDGRTLWLENRVTPFSWDENGELREVIGISHDITDMKLAHEVLQRDRETFERLVNERTAELVDIHHELDKARHLSDIGMLASTVAHELRNPLGVIKTAVYNINRKKQGDALDKHLKTIDKKVEESNQIINNLLMYARIKQPAYETVKIGYLLRESIESARARNVDGRVTFLDDCGPVENATATVDPLQITEVMSNILTNAAQAIPPEGSGSVTVSARAENGMLRITVSDTGAGIDPDMLPRVFDPFFTSKSKGTGLGLSLCKELIALHNGSIDIESEPGKGTTVTVILPL